MSEEIISGIAEWRQQHPQATFRELEEEVDWRLVVMRAKMLADAALSSAQRDWEQGSQAERCPGCGAILERKGKKKGKLLADWERDCGKRQQTGGRSSLERLGNALGSRTCQSYAGTPQCDLLRSMEGRLAEDRSQLTPTSQRPANPFTPLSEGCTANSAYPTNTAGG